MNTPGFAVLNFETTGASASARAVEVGVVHLDPSGVITDRWDTLINPLRHIGPHELHRITYRDVLNAPTFTEAAPQLVELLNGRVLVTHNASVSVSLLHAELDRLSYTAPPLTLTSLSTMELAREFLPRSSRTLAACCAKYAIPYARTRQALTDAEATARVLGAFINLVPRAKIWPETISSATRQRWPAPDWAAADWFSRHDIRRAA